MVCVVETGMPSQVAANKVIAPPVSAQKPCTGVSRVIFEPMVLHDAPAARQRAQAHGRLAGDHHPERHVELAAEMPCEYSRTAMMPMVFCASLPPWPSE